MPTNITIKNNNVQNFIKITQEDATVESDPKTKKQTKTWKKTSDKFLKPGEFEDIWIAETRQITLTEMPT